MKRLHKILKYLFSIVLFSLGTILFGCNSRHSTYTYEAESGGIIYGNLIQTVEVGQTLTQVYAQANDGYRFTGWDDGITSSSRIDAASNDSVL